MFSAFPVLWMPAFRLQWKTSAGRCRTWQAVGLAKTLVLVRLNEKRKSLKTLRTQAAKDAAERRSHRDSRGYTTLDDRQIAAQRRASSDEQVKQPSQNEIARKPSKFSAARKTPAENSASLKSLRVPLVPREKILIWQGSGGVPRNLYTSGL
jgi:hypothetical protein